MIITHVKLKNWRNFREVDVEIGDRVFLVGPNASGKSNFLDVFRFLRDIAKPGGGGLQKAINDRGGISKIRCLAARIRPEIVIEIQLSESRNKLPSWTYSIGIKQQQRGKHLPILAHEKVFKGEKEILKRPDKYDEKDELRLTETHLENINANAEFRYISNFLSSIFYFHLIPQLLQHPNDFRPSFESSDDPFGRNFLKLIGMARKDSRESRLRKIEKALRLAVPQLTQLSYITDEKEGGIPHLEAIYEHWRPHAGKQREDQFSDGTLRMIALLWSLLERRNTMLLFEEPESSLHAGIVSKLPVLMHHLLTKAKQKRQIILSTHSAELLSDKAIGGEEVIILSPDKEGTYIRQASSISEIKFLLESGLSIADTVLPHTEPSKTNQLELFDV